MAAETMAAETTETSEAEDRGAKRGLLFYRLLPNAVQVDPVPYRQLVGGSSRSDHNM